MDVTQLALNISREAHFGQKDKGDKPYIEHPLAVAASFTDEIRIAVALLHDVIEDTEITLTDLKARGVPVAVLEALDAITKRKEESYETYLSRVKANKEALDVKLADLRHNMDLSRIPNPTKKDKARLDKYTFAVKFLTAV